MLRDTILALWFFLPAGVGNMTPIFAAKLPLLRRWNAPMDAGLTFGGRRLLGAHKTWRGLVCGVAAATVVLWLQQVVTAHVPWLAAAAVPLNYARLPVMLLGPLFAVGALGGDAIESFFKRRRDIPSGHSWFPFDQLDYIIGAAVVTLPVAVLPWTVYGCAVVLWLLIHLGVSFVGYLVGLKERAV